MSMLYRIIAMVMILAALSGPAGSSEDEGEQNILWAAPEDGKILLIPGAGYAEGREIRGFDLSMRGVFAFEYFMAGLHGQAIFTESGVLYNMAVDVILRWGPLYAGGSATAHWFPSDSSVPKPGMAVQAGIHVPTPFDGFFIDLAYRPNFIFLDSRTLVFHSILLGLLFETGG